MVHRRRGKGRRPADDQAAHFSMRRGSSSALARPRRLVTRGQALVLGSHDLESLDGLAAEGAGRHQVLARGAQLAGAAEAQLVAAAGHGHRHASVHADLAALDGAVRGNPYPPWAAGGGGADSWVGQHAAIQAEIGPALSEPRTQEAVQQRVNLALARRLTRLRTTCCGVGGAGRSCQRGKQERLGAHRSCSQNHTQHGDADLAPLTDPTNHSPLWRISSCSCCTVWLRMASVSASASKSARLPQPCGPCASPLSLGAAAVWASAARRDEGPTTSWQWDGVRNAARERRANSNPANVASTNEHMVQTEVTPKRGSAPGRLLIGKHQSNPPFNTPHTPAWPDIPSTQLTKAIPLRAALHLINGLEEACLPGSHPGPRDQANARESGGRGCLPLSLLSGRQELPAAVLDGRIEHGSQHARGGGLHQEHGQRAQGSPLPPVLQLLAGAGDPSLEALQHQLLARVQCHGEEGMHAGSKARTRRAGPSSCGRAGRGASRE